MVALSTLAHGLFIGGLLAGGVRGRAENEPLISYTVELVGPAAQGERQFCMPLVVNGERAIHCGMPIAPTTPPLD